MRHIVFEGILRRIRNEIPDGVRLRFGDGRRFRRAVLVEGIKKFCALNPDCPQYEDDDSDSDHPILDFLQRLIDSGKIQAFLKWFFEALPVLIQAIVTIFAVI